MSEPTTKPDIGSWPHLIEFAEEKLRLARLRVFELEGLLLQFRQLDAAGKPSPADLARSIDALAQPKRKNRR